MTFDTNVKNIITGQLLAPSSENPSVREMVFYSGTPVIRVNKQNQLFHLSFSLAPESIDLSVLSKGTAPFVMDHIEDLDHHLGVIERAWLDGVGRASVRFSDREEFQGIIGDIKSGIVSNVSMGAEVLDIQKAEPVERGIPHLKASRWKPYHISAVSRGADHNAHFLSAACMEVAPELLESLSADSGAASEADRARYLIQLQRMRHEAGL